MLYNLSTVFVVALAQSAETPKQENMRIYTQKLQMITICVHAQIPMREAELFCVRLQKLQSKSICAYTQKLQTSSICVGTQIPNRDAELFCVRLQKLQEKKICAYTQKLQTSSTCVYAQIANADAKLFANVCTNSKI